jgi:hypothetical protein
MPKSAAVFIGRCRAFKDALTSGDFEAPPESLRIGPVGFSLSGEGC